MWCATSRSSQFKRAHELETNLRPATVRRYERHETDLRCRFGLRRVLHANKLYRFHRCQRSRPSVVRNANDRPSRSEDESRSRRFATNRLDARGHARLPRGPFTPRARLDKRRYTGVEETQRGSHGPYRCPTPTVPFVNTSRNRRTTASRGQPGSTAPIGEQPTNPGSKWSREISVAVNCRTPAGLTILCYRRP